MSSFGQQWLLPRNSSTDLFCDYAVKLVEREQADKMVEAEQIHNMTDTMRSLQKHKLRQRGIENVPQEHENTHRGQLVQSPQSPSCSSGSYNPNNPESRITIIIQITVQKIFKARPEI